MNSTSKTVLVTGSSSGIGFEVARSFLENGWNVVVNGRNSDRLKSAAQRLGHSDRLAAIAGSTAERVTGESMVGAAREQFGGIDVLVNNAGEFRPKPFLDVAEQDLEHYYSVNLKGTYLTTQAAVRGMTAQGRGGSIVNIGTVLVEHAMSWVHATAPLVFKGGIHALTLLLASELASIGIRVNGIAPGFIRTPLMEGGNDEPLAAAALLGRVGGVRDIAGAVHYLAESSFVTGTILNVDGGYVTGRR